MIRIRRPSRVPSPSRSPALQAAKRHITAFYARDSRARAQESFSFETSAVDNPAVREVLRDLFHGKSAYCEKLLGYEDWGVDHFRPPAHALGVDGSVAPDHY